MLITLIVLTLVEISSQAGSLIHAQSRYKKTWEFNMPRGTVNVGVVTPTDSQSRPFPPSLDIFYRGEPDPSLPDEVGFLRQVFGDLESLKIDPRTITAINMRGPAEPEVKRRLAIAALNSEEWHNLTAKGFGSAEIALEHLLNALKIYDALNEVLADYQLRVKSVGAEKVAATKCLDSRISDLPCSARRNPRIPTGANLSIALEKAR